MGMENVTNCPRVSDPENQAPSNVKFALQITIRVVIFIISGLSLFLWFYNASLDYEVDVMSTVQQEDTNYFTTNKYILYDLNPGSLDIWLAYDTDYTLNDQEEEQMEDDRDLFANQHRDEWILTVTAEYSNGQSEDFEFYFDHRLLGTRTYGPTSYDLKMSIPTGAVKYTYKVNMDMNVLAEMSYYYNLTIKHTEFTPKNYLLNCRSLDLI